MPVTVKVRRSWNQIKSDILKEWKMPAEDDVRESGGYEEKRVEKFGVCDQGDHGIADKKVQRLLLKAWF